MGKCIFDTKNSGLPHSHRLVPQYNGTHCAYCCFRFHFKRKVDSCVRGNGKVSTLIASRCQILSWSFVPGLRNDILCCAFQQNSNINSFPQIHWYVTTFKHLQVSIFILFEVLFRSFLHNCFNDINSGGNCSWQLLQTWLWSYRVRINHVHC